ncbi:hypothetical protein KIW84_045400 [Lathyrus oleraceus]|uniref:Tyrosine decarboxylase n=1 Tax=Pisum sativum TaxID=3888 RepID=A0A9D4XJ00_PEA|nr:hypothetical protein KIW84_045400 [Pisum sativum]
MNPLDLEEFKRQGYMMIDFIIDYYKNIENYPVLSKVEPGYLEKILPPSPPFQPESIESVLEYVQQNIIPKITHWMSPNYYSYFPSSGSITGFVGEMLSNGFNVVGFNWLSSPAATELETIVMNWLGKMLNLPKCFIFSSNFECGGGGVLVDVENGLVPCYLCATVGTTATNVIDPIKLLCNMANEYDICVHVDVAYADHSALRKSLSTYLEFLHNINSDLKGVIDYKDWKIPLSMKFNSLKLWIIIRSYGIENLKKFLRNHVEMAKTFEELVRKDERFEIIVPTRFALVCFRIYPSSINIDNGSEGL